MARQVDGDALVRVGGRRVTMTDVAREAGCSQATVSFVLNNATSMKLSRETHQRVTEAARRLGYVVPKKSGVGPSGPAHRIGFVVDQLATSPEAALAIDGVSQAARASGAIVLAAQSSGDPETLAEIIWGFKANGISALVYMCIFTREVVLPSEIIGLDIPVFLLNCYTADHAFAAALPSELAGGQRSTRHLVEQGHRRIATITGEIWMEAAQDRLKGYRRALSTADIPYDPALVVEGDWSASAGYDGTRRLLALPHPPTAIFCQNDQTAIGCYEALKEAGYAIPSQMSVIGYDDEEIARHLRPPLTTAVLPHRAMGQWVIDQFEAGETGLSRYPITKLECPLVLRGSVARPRG